MGQPGGSCLWRVIGLEESLKHWAQQVQVSPESASGVLIGAPGTLRIAVAQAPAIGHSPWLRKPAAILRR